MQATAAGRLAFSSSSAFSSSVPAAAASSFRSRRRVIIGIQGALPRFNIKRRGKTFCASVSPNLPKPQKGKKIRTEERRSLVESFVNKYRIANSGRFPTASLVKKEVGGCFYNVRQIIQELEYKQKFSPLKSIDAAESGEVKVSIQHSEEVNYAVKKLEKVSGTEEEISLSTNDRDNKVDKKVPSACDGNELLGKTSNQSFSAIEDCSSSEADKKIDFCDQSLKANIESSSSNANNDFQKDDDQSFGPKPESNIKNKDMFESKGEKEQGNNQVTNKEEKQSELLGRSVHKEPSPKASSLWKNLRSFTDRILSFWKKL